MPPTASAHAKTVQDLVLRLSPPHPHKDRVKAAHKLQELIAETPDVADLAVAADGVVPLLAMAGVVERTEELAPAKGTSAKNAELADSALLALAEMCGVAQMRLEAQGWGITIVSSSAPGADLGTANQGDLYFVSEATESVQKEHPLLAGEGDVPWESRVLFQLQNWITPVKNAEGKMTLPVRVVRHHPSPDDARRVSVLDVLPEVEEAAMQGAKLDSAGVPAGTYTRIMVLGAWQGVDGFRESEMDMAAPPGSDLESWPACTLVGTAILGPGVAAGRVLVAGLVDSACRH